MQTKHMDVFEWQMRYGTKDVRKSLVERGHHVDCQQFRKSEGVPAYLAPPHLLGGGGVFARVRRFVCMF
jgi:hypothetical protein